MITRLALASVALALAAASPRPAVAQPRPELLPPGLVAWYPLEGDTVDRVTRTPAPAVGVAPADGRDGEPRGAVRFDGRGHVDLGERIQPARFTIAAWIRPDAVDRVQVIVSKLRNLPRDAYRNLELRVEAGGRLFLHAPSGSGWEQVTGTRVIPPGRWTHVAAIYDGARAQLYVDGVRDGPPLAVAYQGSQTPTFLGARPEGGSADGRPTGPTFHFRGAMQDVRIFDRPIPEADLAHLARAAPPPPPPPPPAPAPSPSPEPAPAEARLLAWYPLDGDAQDAAGRADGRLVGALRPAEDRHGDARGALAFGGRDHVDLGVRTEPERLSIAAWVRPARLDRDQVIFSKASGGRGGRERWLELRLDAGGRPSLAAPGGRGGRVQQLRGPRPLAIGRWAHLAATFDGDRAVLYVDGRAEAEARLEPFAASPGPVFLGARPDPSGQRARSGTFLEGRIDDVRIFRGALEPLAVAALAQERPGRPRPAPQPGDEDAELLVQVNRLVAQLDAAALRRSARRVQEAEARALELLAEAERDPRHRRGRVGSELRRALHELSSARGALDARSLDRRRAALVALSDALWREVAEDLEDDPLGDERAPRRRDRREEGWR